MFMIFSVVAGLATYTVVSAYMADVPEFNKAHLLIPSLTSFIHDKDGVEVTPLMGAENRIQVSLDQISPDLVNAFIAIEDERFFDHPGFDIKGIMRAATNNILNRSAGMQGGSTITQQLVKNVYFDPKNRTMKRKIQELYISYQLERSFTKDEILEFYLNRIFFDFNAYGVEAAAQTYFGKSAKDVTLAEAAILAGIPNLPGKYSPLRNFEESKKRQALILNRMAEIGMITSEQAKEARDQELTLAPPPKRSYPYPYFIDYVIQDEAMRILGSLPEFKDLPKSELYDFLYKGGLRIYTTLDQEKQQFVEDTLNNPDLYPNLTVKVPEGAELPPIQAAAIVAEPSTGYIVAMVGGRDYDDETNVFNRVVRGRMQAGSVLKPILAFAPAFAEKVASPATVIDESPTVFQTRAGKSYHPNNYDREFLGLITARFSLIRSRNIPSIYLLDKLGVTKGKEYAQRMGITSFTEDDSDLAMAVGGLSKGVSVYEVAQAYSVLANEGIRTDLTTITKITDNSGNVIYEHSPTVKEILTPQAAWLTTSVLEDVVTHAWGTAAGLRVGRPIAAKTGTSEYNRDVWLATYTPHYVSVFWTGRDMWPDEKGKEKIDGRFVSGRHSNPFMNPIIKFIHEGLPKSEFTQPSGLRSATVCNKSGLRPSELCPEEHIVTDWFLPDQIPGGTCAIHIEVEVCAETGLLTNEFCPDDLRETKVFLNRPEFIQADERWGAAAGKVPHDAELMPPKDICDIHMSRPGEPSELKATVSADGTVTLSWVAGSNAAGYLVSRKYFDADSYTLLTEQPTDRLYYHDKVLIPGTYTYQVTASNSQGVKSSAVTISVTVAVTQPPEYPPTDENRNGNGNGNN